MTVRLQFHELLPDVFNRLLNLHQRIEKEARDHGVPQSILELVKIRASQINGCAFCLDMHTRDALAAGEQQRRLNLVATWRESSLFSAQERAALALTEAISRTSSTQEVGDEVYDEAARQFSPEELAVVVWAAAEIQLFNALNVTSRKPLPPG